MFVNRVIEEYTKLWNNENAKREDFHRFHCKLSQAMALGVMTREEYDEINEKMAEVRNGGMKKDAARLAAAFNA